MTWVLLALMASMLWGLTYVIQEVLFEKITVTSYLTIVSFFSFLIFAGIGYAQSTLLPDLKAINLSKELGVWTVFAIAIYVAAELCIGFSILNKNAALAGIIEISYPLFIVLFTFIILNKNQITWFTAVGGVLIGLGAAIISISTAKHI